MNNILFVAYMYPPLMNPGSYRSYDFTKYLPSFGINPIVVTLSQKDYAFRFPTNWTDESFLQHQTSLDIIPIESSFNASRLANELAYWWTPNLFGDEMKSWWPHLLQKLPDLINRYNPKAVIATGPPFSVLNIGRKISRRYNLPLIVDFRDAWSQWCHKPYSSRLQYWHTLTAEKRVLKQAYAVLTTSDQTKKDLQKIHPEVNDYKYSVITNGYDEDVEFKSEILVPSSPKKLVIGYVGSFYFSEELHEMIYKPWYKKIRKSFATQPYLFQYVPHRENWHYRTPFYFFKALRQLLTDYPELSGIIEIKFAGNKPAWFDAMVAEFQLETSVRHLGVLSHADSLIFQDACDALLITSAKKEGGLDFSIAGKTFEYFSMQKPILGFVTPGSQRDILESSGLAVLFDPDNPAESADKLRKLVKNGLTLTPNLKFLKSLHRRQLTSSLSAIINNAIENNEINS